MLIDVNSCTVVENVSDAGGFIASCPTSGFTLCASGNILSVQPLLTQSSTPLSAFHKPLDAFVLTVELAEAYLEVLRTASVADADVDALFVHQAAVSAAINDAKSRLSRPMPLAERFAANRVEFVWEPRFVLAQCRSLITEARKLSGFHSLAVSSLTEQAAALCGQDFTTACSATHPSFPASVPSVTARYKAFCDLLNRARRPKDESPDLLDDEKPSNDPLTKAAQFFVSDAKKHADTDAFYDAMQRQALKLASVGYYLYVREASSGVAFSDDPNARAVSVKHILGDSIVSSLAVPDAFSVSRDSTVFKVAATATQSALAHDAMMGDKPSKHYSARSIPFEQRLLNAKPLHLPHGETAVAVCGGQDATASPTGRYGEYVSVITNTGSVAVYCSQILAPLEPVCTFTPTLSSHPSVHVPAVVSQSLSTISHPESFRIASVIQLPSIGEVKLPSAPLELSPEFMALLQSTTAALIGSSVAGGSGSPSRPSRLPDQPIPSLKANLVTWVTEDLRVQIIKGPLSPSLGSVSRLPGDDIPAATVSVDALGGYEEFVSFDDIEPLRPVCAGVICVVIAGSHKGQYVAYQRPHKLSHDHAVVKGHDGTLFKVKLEELCVTAGQPPAYYDHSPESFSATPSGAATPRSVTVPHAGLRIAVLMASHVTGEVVAALYHRPRDLPRGASMSFVQVIPLLTGATSSHLVAQYVSTGNALFVASGSFAVKVSLHPSTGLFSPAVAVSPPHDVCAATTTTMGGRHVVVVASSNGDVTCLDAASLGRVSSGRVDSLHGAPASVAACPVTPDRIVVAVGHSSGHVSLLTTVADGVAVEDVSMTHEEEYGASLILTHEAVGSLHQNTVSPFVSYGPPGAVFQDAKLSLRLPKPHEVASVELVGGGISVIRSAEVRMSIQSGTHSTSVFACGRPGDGVTYQLPVSGDGTPVVSGWVKFEPQSPAAASTPEAWLVPVSPVTRRQPYAVFFSSLSTEGDSVSIGDVSVPIPSSREAVTLSPDLFEAAGDSVTISYVRNGSISHSVVVPVVDSNPEPQFGVHALSGLQPVASLYGSDRDTSLAIVILPDYSLHAVVIAPGNDSVATVRCYDMKARLFPQTWVSLRLSLNVCGSGTWNVGFSCGDSSHTVQNVTLPMFRALTLGSPNAFASSHCMFTAWQSRDATVTTCRLGPSSCEDVFPLCGDFSSWNGALPSRCQGGFTLDASVPNKAALVDARLVLQWLPTSVGLCQELYHTVSRDARICHVQGCVAGCAVGQVAADSGFVNFSNTVPAHHYQLSVVNVTPRGGLPEDCISVSVTFRGFAGDSTSTASVHRAEQWITTSARLTSPEYAVELASALCGTVISSPQRVIACQQLVELGRLRVIDVSTLPIDWDAFWLQNVVNTCFPELESAALSVFLLSGVTFLPSCVLTLDAVAEARLPGVMELLCAKSAKCSGAFTSDGVLGVLRSMWSQLEADHASVVTEYPHLTVLLRHFGVSDPVVPWFGGASALGRSVFGATECITRQYGAGVVSTSPAATAALAGGVLKFDTPTSTSPKSVLIDLGRPCVITHAKLCSVFDFGREKRNTPTAGVVTIHGSSTLVQPQPSSNRANDNILESFWRTPSTGNVSISSNRIECFADSAKVVGSAATVMAAPNKYVIKFKPVETTGGPGMTFGITRLSQTGAPSHSVLYSHASGQIRLLGTGFGSGGDTATTFAAKSGASVTMLVDLSDQGTVALSSDDSPKPVVIARNIVSQSGVAWFPYVCFRGDSAALLVEEFTQLNADKTGPKLPFTCSEVYSGTSGAVLRGVVKLDTLKEVRVNVCEPVRFVSVEVSWGTDPVSSSGSFALELSLSGYTPLPTDTVELEAQFQAAKAQQSSAHDALVVAHRKLARATSAFAAAIADRRLKWVPLCQFQSLPETHPLATVVDEMREIYQQLKDEVAPTVWLADASVDRLCEALNRPVGPRPAAWRVSHLRAMIVALLKECRTMLPTDAVLALCESLLFQHPDPSGDTDVLETLSTLLPSVTTDTVMSMFRRQLSSSASSAVSQSVAYQTLGRLLICSHVSVDVDALLQGGLHEASKSAADLQLVAWVLTFVLDWCKRGDTPAIREPTLEALLRFASQIVSAAPLKPLSMICIGILEAASHAMDPRAVLTLLLPCCNCDDVSIRSSLTSLLVWAAKAAPSDVVVHACDELLTAANVKHPAPLLEMLKGMVAENRTQLPASTICSLLRLMLSSKSMKTLAALSLWCAVLDLLDAASLCQTVSTHASALDAAKQVFSLIGDCDSLSLEALCPRVVTLLSGFERLVVSDWHSFIMSVCAGLLAALLPRCCFTDNAPPTQRPLVAIVAAAVDVLVKLGLQRDYTVVGHGKSDVTALAQTAQACVTILSASSCSRDGYVIVDRCLEALTLLADNSLIDTILSGPGSVLLGCMQWLMSDCVSPLLSHEILGDEITQPLCLMVGGQAARVALSRSVSSSSCHPPPLKRSRGSQDPASPAQPSPEVVDTADKSGSVEGVAERVFQFMSKMRDRFSAVSALGSVLALQCTSEQVNTPVESTHAFAHCVRVLVTEPAAARMLIDSASSLLRAVVGNGVSSNSKEVVPALLELEHPQSIATCDDEDVSLNDRLVFVRADSSGTRLAEYVKDLCAAHARSERKVTHPAAGGPASSTGSAFHDLYTELAGLSADVPVSMYLDEGDNGFEGDDGEEGYDDETSAEPLAFPVPPPQPPPKVTRVEPALVEIDREVWRCELGLTVPSLVSKLQFSLVAGGVAVSADKLTFPQRVLVNGGVCGSSLLPIGLCEVTRLPRERSVDITIPLFRDSYVDRIEVVLLGACGASLKLSRLQLSDASGSLAPSTLTVANATAVSQWTQMAMHVLWSCCVSFPETAVMLRSVDVFPTIVQHLSQGISSGSFVDVKFGELLALVLLQSDELVVNSAVARLLESDRLSPAAAACFEALCCNVNSQHFRTALCSLERACLADNTSVSPCLATVIDKCCGSKLESRLTHLHLATLFQLWMQPASLCLPGLATLLKWFSPMKDACQVSLRAGEVDGACEYAVFSLLQPLSTPGLLTAHVTANEFSVQAKHAVCLFPAFATALPEDPVVISMTEELAGCLVMSVQSLVRSPARNEAMSQACRQLFAACKQLCVVTSLQTRLGSCALQGVSGWLCEWQHCDADVLEAAFPFVQSCIANHDDNKSVVAKLIMTVMSATSSVPPFITKLLSSDVTRDECVLVSVACPFGSSFALSPDAPCGRYAAPAGSHGLLDAASLSASKDAAFQAGLRDVAFSSSNVTSAHITFGEDGRLISSVASRYDYAAVDVNLSEKAGVYTMTYEVIAMKHELCFGVTSLPFPANPTPPSLSEHRLAWVVQARIGAVYAMGKSLHKSVPKAAENSIVKLRYDNIKHALSYAVDDADFQEVCDNVVCADGSSELYPAVGLCCTGSVRFCGISFEGAASSRVATGKLSAQSDTEPLQRCDDALSPHASIMFPAHATVQDVQAAFGGTGPRFVWQCRGNRLTDASTPILTLCRDGNVAELSFTVAYRREDGDVTTSLGSTSPLLHRHASRCALLRWIAQQPGGLSRLLRDDVLSRYASTATDEHKVPDKDPQRLADIAPPAMWSFLSQFRSLTGLTGYGATCVTDPEVVTLFLHALGVETGGSVGVDTLLDPASALLRPLSQLLATAGPSAPQIITEACDAGVVDKLLLEIGRIEGFEPRDSEWVRQFENPVDVVRRQEEKQRRAAEAAVKAAETREEASSGKQYWAKGTGYGHGHPGRADANIDTNALKKRDSRRVASLVRLFAAVKSLLDPFAGQVTLPSMLTKRCEASCLVPVLSSYLRSTEVDIVSKPSVYKAVYALLGTIASVPGLATLLDVLPDQSSSLCTLLQEQAGVAQEFFQMEAGPTTASTPAGPAAGDGSGLPPTSPPKLARSSSRGSLGGKSVDDVIMTQLLQVAERVTAAVEAHKQRLATVASASSATDAAMEGDSGSLEALYVKALKDQVIDRVNMDEDGKGYRTHKFRSEIASGMSQNSRNCLTRVQKEIRAMKTSLPVEFNSSILLRYDKTRPYVMQAVIFPSENTPYDSGAFLFDIYCPPTYPQTPPHVNIITTGGGQVRFNPNLYNTGKVCLSLLGTWRGGGSAEEWNDKSTLLQVLVSIQALIFVEFPYFNEPGVEASMGTPQGERGKRTGENGGYERLRVWTIQWAMVDQLRNPSPGFEEAIREHFRLKRAYILRTTSKWLQEATDSDTPGHYEALKAQRDALIVELRKLGPSPCDGEPESVIPPEPAAASASEDSGLTSEQLVTLETLLSLFPEADLVQLKECIVKSNGSVEGAADYFLGHFV